LFSKMFNRRNIMKSDCLLELISSSDNGYPTANTKLLHKPIQDIITYGNQVLRGVMNSNRGCINYSKGSYIQYIILYSLAKTVARSGNITFNEPCSTIPTVHLCNRTM